MKLENILQVFVLFCYGFFFYDEKFFKNKYLHCKKLTFESVPVVVVKQTKKSHFQG